MKSLNLICILFVLTCFNSKVEAANNFHDVDDNFWAKSEIDFLAKQSIVGGYNDGRYLPNNTITRAQAAMMIVNALDLSVENRPDPKFKDIIKSFHAFDYVATVADEGIINGSNGNFMPNKPLTRGQMAAILDRAFKLAPYQSERLFRDINQDYIFYRSIQKLAFHRITTGYNDRTFRPNEPTTRAQFAVFLARVLNDSFRPTIEEQVIVVTTNSLTNQKATLRTYETRNGNVQPKFSPISAVVGYNGIGENKREGGGQTPIGTYSLTHAFGTAPAPSGVKLPYQRTTKNDYWIDDPSSSDYNQWRTYSGDPNRKWKSFERLYIDLYKYAVVMDYNTNPIVPGKGSAIFLHVWKGASSPTAGCVAVSESDLVKLLQWIDPKKAPVIIISLENQVPAF